MRLSRGEAWLHQPALARLAFALGQIIDKDVIHHKNEIGTKSLTADWYEWHFVLINHEDNHDDASHRAR